MESALRTLLYTHAPLVAKVPADRIVWNHLPQAKQRPAIVLYRVAGAPGLHMRGSDNLLAAVVQIDVQALDVTSMWAIRDIVTRLLHGYRGGIFQGIALRAERQDSDEIADGVIVHRASLDFDVWAVTG